MGRMGARTGYPSVRVAVLRPSELQSVGERDVLLVSTLSRVSGASQLLDYSPYRVSEGRLSVTLPGALEGIWRLFGDPTSERRQQLAAKLFAPLGDGAAVMIGAPLAHGRSLVAVLAGSPQGLDAMVDVLRDPKQLSNIEGDLTLLSGGTVTSYRAGSTYTLGNIPVWLWPAWWLTDRPISMFAVVLLACGVMGYLLHKLLRRRAAVRVRRAGTGS
jgi:cellulose synthase (UDP-forming)